MSTMGSQITDISIVCTAVCWGANQRKHQSSASLAIVQGIHWWPVNSLHKGPVTLKLFPFDNIIMGHSSYALHQNCTCYLISHIAVICITDAGNCFLFNILRPDQNCRQSVDSILKCIFLKEIVWILLKISMKFVSEGIIEKKSVLVPVTVWHWTSTIKLIRHLKQWWPSSLRHYVSPGPRLNIKTIFPGMGIPISKIRQSWDHLILNMGIPILGRWHPHIETGRWHQWLKVDPH